MEIFPRIVLNNHTVRIQDKRTWVVLLNNEQCCEKIQCQINRSSFTYLNSDHTKTFKDKINTWIKKWVSCKAVENPKDVKTW